MSIAIIVDAVLSGNAMAGEFKARGVECWHVWSSVDRRDANQALFRPDFYKKVFTVGEGDLRAFLDSGDEEIIAVLPASDSGVHLANYITEGLCDVPQRNEWITLELRQNRFALTQRMDQETVDHDFEAFLATHKRIIVKPKRSNGGYENVYDVLHKEDLPSEEGMFAMPFYEGVEYGVDTASLQGRHRIVAIWRYKKRPNSIMRWHVELVNPADEPTTCLRVRDFVTKVLKTADYRVGCTHTEIMDTSQGLRLIESNFRNHNGMDYETTRVACGRNQVQLGVDAFLGIDSQFDVLNLRATHAGVRQLFFTNTVEGLRMEEIDWEAVRDLQSFTRLFSPHGPQSVLPMNSFTYREMTGSVILMNVNKERLEEDEHRLREIMYSAGQVCE